MSEYAFDANTVLAAARDKAGLSDFGDEGFAKGLGVLLETYDAPGALTESGRKKNWKRLVNLLATRLRVEAAFARHPEIREREIRRPVFLTGLPRTGTSALFNLLGMDPATRALLLWEGMFPDPIEGLPPGAEDPRHKGMKEAQARVRAENPEFTKIHFADADTPEECVIPMAITFENVQLGLEVLMEPYQSFFQGLDFRPQYAYYADMLRMLDWQRPGERWLLKSPAHLWALDVLVDLFPDCCILLTHRDPIEAVASYCSMMEALFKGQGYTPRAELGATILEYLARSMERAMAVRDASGEARFLDVRFADFVSDNMGVVRRIYDHFELPLTEQAERAMSDYVRDHPKGKHGAHEYDLERYGINEAQIRDRLGDYIDRFELG
jgi:hypothetical protein